MKTALCDRCKRCPNPQSKLAKVCQYFGHDITHVIIVDCNKFERRDE